MKSRFSLRAYGISGKGTAPLLRRNSLLAEIHDRMPVILPDDVRDTWLRSSARVEELKEMFSPFPSSEMKGFPVGSEVNGAAVDEPGLVKPIGRDREVRAGMLF